MVMLSCGINDVGTGVKPSDFEANVVAIAERMKARRVRLMVLTTTNLQMAVEEPRLDEINRILHRVAAKYGLTVAEVYDRMQQGRKQEKSLWEDGCHLNLAGYRYMARAVLDALGRRDVPAPRSSTPGSCLGWCETGKCCRLPNRGRPWTRSQSWPLRPTPLGEATALPETAKVAAWWFDQERQRGASVSLPQRFGPANGFIAVADIDCPTARTACLNVGAELAAVWLNGKRVVGPGDPPRGWHPGSCRKPVQLLPGKNRIVVETGRVFVSITDDAFWD